jgi:hypothetical protein
VNVSCACAPDQGEEDGLDFMVYRGRVGIGLKVHCLCPTES